MHVSVERFRGYSSTKDLLAVKAGAEGSEMSRGEQSTNAAEVSLALFLFVAVLVADPTLKVTLVGLWGRPSVRVVKYLLPGGILARYMSSGG